VRRLAHAGRERGGVRRLAHAGRERGAGRRRGLRLAAAACAVLALLAAGCGERDERTGPGEPERLELLLDFFPNADHTPIYAAEAGGRFRDVGLDVTVRAPSDPAAPLRQAAAGRVDLAISYEPEILRARDKGLDVVAVGALVQRPLTSIISLPSARIRKPADLRGKEVGTAGIDYQSAFLQAILEKAGVDPATVKERNVGFDLVPALLTKKVDATLGAYFNYEGVDLRLRKKDPRIVRMDQAGVPTYDELVLVASRKTIESKGGAIRGFIGALARATADLERDPKRGLDALLEANRDLDARLQRAALKETLPLFAPPAGRPFGWQEPREWAAFGRFMHEAGLVQGGVEGAFTNELLPGGGL
jgi:putative hydroxymethylpyrimidine transport system substrate-binding protein